MELESGGKRLVLDLGRPLDAGLDEELPLPAIAGLADGDDSLVGVVISHGHPDHWGLAGQLSQSVPLFVGEATAAILREAAFFTPTGIDLRPTAHLRDRQPLQLGPFTITPHLVDHSAFDAYALLVEAEGRRLFYSGDLRDHGRKPGRLRELIERPPSVDILILEGTQVSREGEPMRDPISEQGVEAECVALFEETAGIVLANYSGQNVDRLVTIYRAAKRTGRTLVMDLYTATIATATKRETIPQATWENVLVYVPQVQRIRVKRAREFERVAAIRDHRIYPEDLSSRASELVLTFRASMSHEVERARCLKGASALWSLWPGYLDSQSGRDLQHWFEEQSIPLTIAHASGHATTEDLQRLAAALDADQIVPIHTWAPERFAEHFDRVRLRGDGQWWTV